MRLTFRQPIPPEIMARAQAGFDFLETRDRLASIRKRVDVQSITGCPLAQAYGGHFAQGVAAVGFDLGLMRNLGFMAEDVSNRDAEYALLNRAFRRLLHQRWWQR